MKVVYITAWDSFGIQFNGYILGKGLRDAGHDAKMLVARKAFDDPDVSQIGSPIINKLDTVLVKIEEALSLQRVLTLSFGSIFSHPWYREADIVHFQLPHAIPFLNLQLIRRVSQEKKMVWTIHDPWIVSGHCVYSMGCERWKTGCGHCPDLSLNFPISRDTTGFNWRVKKNALDGCQLHMIVASQWMSDVISQSPITNKFPLSIIPFGVDTNIFHPLDKVECRRKFNIPDDAYVLACRWVSYNPAKGVKYLEKAFSLLSLDKPVYVITFDSGNQGIFKKDGFHFIDLGWVTDQTIVVDALNAADLFIMPSTAEAFGMMAIEAMSCSTPVIVFEGTALPDVVHAPNGGVSVSRNSEDLARAIHYLLDNFEIREGIAIEGLQIIQKEYKVDQYVSRHIELYESLLFRT